MNRYTITKAIITYETYSVVSDTPENAVKSIDEDLHFVDSETIEPEYTIVNIEQCQK